MGSNTFTQLNDLEDPIVLRRVIENISEKVDSIQGIRNNGIVGPASIVVHSEDSDVSLLADTINDLIQALKENGILR